jgi:hypothetical protein
MNKETSCRSTCQILATKTRLDNNGKLKDFIAVKRNGVQRSSPSDNCYIHAHKIFKLQR